MKLLLLFVVLLIELLGYGQFKQFPTINIKNLQQKSFFCFDSTGRKITPCSVDLDGFDVDFYKAFLNNKTSEVRLIGRLVPSHAHVGIYLSNADSISLKSPISRTSYDKENLNNDGFFDVTFKVDPNSRLYFYELPYFPKQFDISRLLKQK